jgi:hypothetical protein
MYHCPECGEMVLAGVAHPDYSILEDEEGLAIGLTMANEKISFDEAVEVVRGKVGDGAKFVQPTGSVLCPDCGATCFTYEDRDPECDRCGLLKKTKGEWVPVDPVTLEPLHAEEKKEDVQREADVSLGKEGEGAGD